MLNERSQDNALAVITVNNSAFSWMSSLTRGIAVDCCMHCQHCWQLTDAIRQEYYLSWNKVAGNVLCHDKTSSPLGSDVFKSFYVDMKTASYCSDNTLYMVFSGDMTCKIIISRWLASLWLETLSPCHQRKPEPLCFSLNAITWLQVAQVASCGALQIGL